MSGLSRKLQGQKAKSEGTLVYKKKVAKKLGISVAELDYRMKRREKNLNNFDGGTENGKG